MSEGVPEALPVLAVEVDVVDVLVLLGRVLGVLERAVGPAEEPLGVLGQPGMVRGALDGEVEGDLEAQLPGIGDERVEVVDRAEVGVDGGVAAGVGADRPGAAGIVGTGGEAVVRALAVGPADRVHRREVEHVEAQLGDGGQPAAHPGEAAPRPGEQLVPGTAAGDLRVDHDLVRRFPGEGPLEVGVVLGGRDGLGGERRGGALDEGAVGVADDVGGAGQQAAHRALRPFGGGVEKPGSLCQHAAQVLLAGFEPTGQLALPGLVAVGPGPHRPGPGAELVEGEVGLPAVGVRGIGAAVHGQLDPAAAVGGLPPQRGTHRFVAVVQGVGGDVDGVADRPLERMITLDGGRDLQDPHPCRRLRRERAGVVRTPLVLLLRLRGLGRGRRATHEAHYPVARGRKRRRRDQGRCSGPATGTGPEPAATCRAPRPARPWSWTTARARRLPSPARTARPW